jgi:Na+/H+-dicarboxylate symporter
MFFAIMTGIAISALKDKEKAAALIDLFRSFGDVMQKILGFVMGFTPFGVMGIIAWMVGAHGLSILVPFASFVAAVYAASIFYVIVVQVILMARVVGKVSPIVFLRGAKEAMLFVFATSSSFATLPLALAASMKMGVSNRITNFVIPYGTVINMDGTAIYLAIAVVFVARIYGIALGLNEMILIVLTATLASIGTAGVPGAGVVMLNIVLISLNLPLGAVALLLGFDRMISPTRATPNVVGDLAVAVMVARLNGEMKDNPALEEGVSPIAVGEVEAAR